MTRSRLMPRSSAIPADADLADRFGVEAGTLMLHRQYWHSISGDPTALSLIDSYLVHEVAARNPDLWTAPRSRGRGVRTTN